MGQWIILIFFVSLLAGMAALSALFQMARESNERLLKEFLFFFSAFTLMILLSLVYYYTVAHVPSPSLVYIQVLLIVSQAVNTVFVYSLARYTNAQKNLSGIRWLHYALIGASVVFFVSGLLAGRPSLENKGFIALQAPWSTVYIILFAVLLSYSFLPFQGKPSGAQDGSFGRFTKKLDSLSYVFLPFIMADILLNNSLPVRFFPLLYTLYAVLLTVFINRGRRTFYDPSARLTADEAFYEQKGLSRREREVLELIVQGQTNPQIAKRLFISLPTVKTHIQRIFQKTGVESRFELVRFFTRPDPRDHSSNADPS